MTRARLMTQPQDHARLGTEPGVVGAWENGCREGAAPGSSELWHFEASMDDGTTTAVAFCLVGPDPAVPGSASTVVNLFVTLPDGRRLQRTVPGSVPLSAVGTSRCDLPFAPHSASGDLESLSVTVEPVEGVGVDLSYEALVGSYRPGGTAHVALGERDESHYALHAVARCRVTGTLTAEGRTWQVAGLGYHDHQWTDVDLLESWHHWLWGRLHTEHLTVVVDDLVTSERFGFARVPLLGVLDESGAVVFDNRGPVESEVETRRDPTSGKDHPRRVRYLARDGERTVELDFTRTDELVTSDVYAASDAPPELGGGQRERFDRLGIRPSYARYRAEGTVTLTDASGTLSESGEMIYELNDVGRPDERAPLA